MERTFSYVINWIYIIVGFLFAILILIFGHVQTANITTSAESGTVREITDYTETYVEDESAPIGGYYSYEFTLPEIERGDNLIFFESHQYVEVYINGERRYAFFPLDEDFMLGRSLGHAWMEVSLDPKDEGATVEVRMLPVYEGVKTGYLHFFCAEPINFEQHQYTSYALAIALCSAIFVLGIVILAIGVSRRARNKNTDHFEALALFCLFLAIWKGTDMNVSPLIFSANPPVLSYISLTCLYLIPIPIFDFLQSKLTNRTSQLFFLLKISALIMEFVFVLLQGLRIKDYREELTSYHIFVAASMIIILLIVIREVRETKHKQKRAMILASMIGLMGCITLDIYFYYYHDTTDMYATMIAVLVYIISLLVYRERRLSKDASMDQATGLYNKNYCIEALNDLDKEQVPYVIAIFDMNGLKRMNDEFGHDAGDRMIEAFGNLLRNQISRSAFIGRFGGDEFLVIYRNPQVRFFERALENLRRRASRTTVMWFEGNTTYLSYSEGHAYSTEFKGCTAQEIFEEADRRMYESKKRYYEEKDAISKSNDSRI